MKNIILASFALFALAGCSKQPAEVTPTGEGVELVITPTMAGSVAATKALVPNDKFIHDAKVGFTILNSTAPNTGAAHLSGYYNIMARGASNINATSVVDKWTYYVNGLYMGRALAGVPLQNSTIDVYGYYPYNPEMTDITAVPFSIATTVGAVTTATEEQATTDYMWATPKTNYQIQDGRDDLAYPLPISMNFNHLMTCLEFRIRKAYYGPELNVLSITFEIAGRPFTIDGTYNAKSATRSITPGNTSTKITVNYSGKKINNGDVNTSIPMQFIFPELMVLDGGNATIKATFTFKGTDAADLPIAPAEYSFQLSQVTGGGLAAGVRYQVNVDVANYTKFSGTPLVVEQAITDSGVIIDPIEI